MILHKLDDRIYYIHIIIFYDILHGFWWSHTLHIKWILFFGVHLVPKKALSDRGDGEDVSNPVVYVKTAKEAAMAAQAWKLTAAAEATRLPPRPFLEGVFYMRDSSGVVDPCGSPKFWLVKPP